MTLRKEYENLVNKYLLEFCNRYGFDPQYSSECWVGGIIGDITECGDYFINFDDIRICVDNNIPFSVFRDHYEYQMRVRLISDDLPVPNLINWHKGALRIPIEKIEELESIKKRLFDSIEELK